MGLGLAGRAERTAVVKESALDSGAVPGLGVESGLPASQRRCSVLHLPNFALRPRQSEPGGGDAAQKPAQRHGVLQLVAAAGGAPCLIKTALAHSCEDTDLYSSQRLTMASNSGSGVITQVAPSSVSHGAWAALSRSAAVTCRAWCVCARVASASSAWPSRNTCFQLAPRRSVS